MQLLLIRHGKAGDSHPDGDFARPLVAAGHAQARAIAGLLASTDELPDICLTSPLVRAMQTAETFCTTAGLPGPIIQPWLASGLHPETALAELVAFREYNRVAIFGHEPDFSSFIEWTLGVHGGSIEMKKSAAACLVIHPPSRHSSLRFLVPPALVQCIDS
ncbi:MAG: histidine phosphatase family protein [Verrucomicrobiota bacterium]